MHFIFDLIRKIIRGKEFAEPVVLWGDGYQKREIVLVDDFVKILWTLTRNVDNDIFNIGAGEEFAIRSFAKYICDIVGYPYNQIEFDIARYIGATSKCLNVHKAQSAIANYSLTPLHTGLQQTIRWFYESGAFKLEK
jgi:GDP-L-fucose synthase